MTPELKQNADKFIAWAINEARKETYSTIMAWEKHWPLMDKSEWRDYVQSQTNWCGVCCPLPIRCGLDVHVETE